MQCLAIKKRSPTPDFGRGCSREQSHRLLTLFSQDHTIGFAHTLSSTHYGTHSPGPIYPQKPVIGGKQPDGGKSPDPPVWSQAKANRFLSTLTGKPDQKPGPERYVMHPAIGGTQPDAARDNRPNWKFGTGTREQSRRVYITKEITQTLLAGTLSPGPANYDLPDNVGPSIGYSGTVLKQNPPKWSLRKRVWPDAGGTKTPGAIYDIPPAVGGRQPDARIVDRPNWIIGTKARPYDGSGLDRHYVEPGQDAPGMIYKVSAGACGRQVSSLKPSKPRMCFTEFSRWSTIEKELRTNSTPGPGVYG